MRTVKILIVIFVFTVPTSRCYRSNGNGLDVSVDVIYDTSFVDHADCIHPVCDILPQCGCPLGFECTLIFSTPGPVRACVPPGNRRPGETCEFFECETGALCLEGICREACMEHVDCPPYNDCIHAIEGESQRACSLTCNLIDGDPCPEGWKCVAHQSEREDRNYYSDCEVSTGDLGFLEECSESSDCVQGIGCTDDCGFFYCTSICDEDPSCPSGVPICGSDDLIGTINGIQYSFCRTWYPTDCDY
jgi:hypothetical protein